MKTMMGVSIAADETATSLRISAPIRPEASARPTPIITTRMIATAAKLRKFATNDVNMKRMPSAESEALDRRGLLDDLVLALLHRRVRKTAGGLRRAALDDLLDGRPAAASRPRR